MASRDHDHTVSSSALTSGQAHTPGPWGLETTAVSHWVGPMKRDGAKVADVVVHVEGGRGTGYTDEYAAKQFANARLISAAPDLLEALMLMEAEKADYMTINNLGDPAREHTNKLARAAIAKATGQ